MRKIDIGMLFFRNKKSVSILICYLIWKIGIGIGIGKVKMFKIGGKFGQSRVFWITKSDKLSYFSLL